MSHGASGSGDTDMNDTRKPLVAGINRDDDFPSPGFPESDARAIARRLACHGDAGKGHSFYHVAPRSHTVELTRFGRACRRLVKPRDS